MEYTNDVIFSVKYNEKKDELVFAKKGIIEKCFSKVKKDDYFKLTMLISILFLGMDFFLIKEFIDIVNSL